MARRSWGRDTPVRQYSTLHYSTLYCRAVLILMTVQIAEWIRVCCMLDYSAWYWCCDVSQFYLLSVNMQLYSNNVHYPTQPLFTPIIYYFSLLNSILPIHPTQAPFKYPTPHSTGPPRGREHGSADSLRAVLNRHSECRSERTDLRYCICAEYYQ
jgi:hypothetical protein